MKQDIFFLNMFSAYQPPEHLETVLSQAAVAAADIDPNNRTIYLKLKLPEYISVREIDDIAEDIEDIYDLRFVLIQPEYPAQVLRTLPPEDLMSFFVTQNSMAIASLSGARWEWSENTLDIHLWGNGESGTGKIRTCGGAAVAGNVRRDGNHQHPQQQKPDRSGAV